VRTQAILLGRISHSKHTTKIAVANAPGVKSANNIQFELMNEPVNIESSPGQNRTVEGS
jgi:hypothetical protein